MAERGEFRSIHKVLLDGPDFQSLSSSARWVFISIKLSLSFCGIGVIPASAAVLSEKTGLEQSVVNDALAELVSSRWVLIEKNVFWIIGGLSFEPGMVPHNRKHRIAVEKQISSLPNLKIVDNFKKHHPEWFSQPEIQQDQDEEKVSDTFSQDENDGESFGDLDTEHRGQRTETDNNNRGQRTEDGNRATSASDFPFAPNIESDIAFVIRSICDKGIVLTEQDTTELRNGLHVIIKNGATLEQAEEVARKVGGSWISRDRYSKQPTTPSIRQVCSNWNAILKLPEPQKKLTIAEKNALDYQKYVDHLAEQEEAMRLAGEAEANANGTAEITSR